jgi:hypothetical protein
MQKAERFDCLLLSEVFDLSQGILIKERLHLIRKENKNGREKREHLFPLS